jgi:hypothetical protein
MPHFRSSNNSSGNFPVPDGTISCYTKLSGGTLRDPKSKTNRLSPIHRARLRNSQCVPAPYQPIASQDICKDPKMLPLTLTTVTGYGQVRPPRPEGFRSCASAAEMPAKPFGSLQRPQPSPPPMRAACQLPSARKRAFCRLPTAFAPSDFQPPPLTTVH